MASHLDKVIISTTWKYAKEAQNEEQKDRIILRIGSDFGYIDRSTTTDYIAIRGSDDREDWRCNFSAWRIRNGWPDGILSVAESIVSKYNVVAGWGCSSEPRFVVVTGHSRGGWIAAAVTWLLQQQGTICRGVFFAPPAQALASVLLDNSYTVYNKHDIIIGLKSLAALGYRALGSVVYLQSADWFQRNRWRRLLPWLRVADHRIPSYDDSIKDWLKC